jgi:hypothetical protein
MNAVVHSICSVMSITAILLAVSNRRNLFVNCGRIKTSAMQNRWMAFPWLRGSIVLHSTRRPQDIMCRHQVYGHSKADDFTLLWIKRPAQLLIPLLKEKHYILTTNRCSQKKKSYVFCHFWYTGVGRNVGLCDAKGVCGIVSKPTEGSS